MANASRSPARSDCSSSRRRPPARRSHSLLHLYLACCIHHAVPTVTIPRIQSDGQFLLRNIPARHRHCSATVLHCVHRSRPETGLLIPSGLPSPDQGSHWYALLLNARLQPISSSSLIYDAGAEPSSYRNTQTGPGQGHDWKRCDLGRGGIGYAHSEGRWPPLRRHRGVLWDSSLRR